MGKIIEKMCEYLDSDDWKYEQDNERHIRLNYSGNSGFIRCHIHSSEDDDFLGVTSVFPLNIPAERRNEVSSLITMINYRLRVGNFKMDYDDGEIAFKASMFLDGCEYGKELMKKTGSVKYLSLF